MLYYNQKKKKNYKNTIDQKPKESNRKKHELEIKKINKQTPCIWRQIRDMYKTKCLVW